MSDNPIERARQLQERWDAEYRDYARRPSFKHLSSSDLIRVADSKRAMSSEEFEALEEAFVEMFGISLVAPVDRRGEREPPEAIEEPELPKGDAALNAKQVCELIGVSVSTLKRMVEDGRFPKPFKASERRIAWSVKDVMAYREANR